VIKTWKNAQTRRFAETGKSKFSGMDMDAANEMLKTLNRLTNLNQIASLRSIHLHKLKGRRKNEWSMTINGPWRVVFTFKDGDAYDVEITDYH
jgi:toxin HigB-1